MRVVVTGGSGFLGSHVADHLESAGHDVTVYDRAPTDRHRAILGDLSDPETLRDAFVGVEAVCHLGAVGDVYLAAEQPALAASANVVGTANVCDAAIAAGVRRVIVASTWEVYGQPRYQPVDESHPCEPDHPYSITKLAGERIARAYTSLRDLDTIALRLGTAYGTRMRSNSVFSIFIRCALAAEPITIQGSGEQSRQFTHEHDIARGFESALKLGRPGAAYNLVAERAITIRELGKAVAALAPTELTLGPARPADVPSAIVTSELAKRDLLWSAETNFEDGLRELVDQARSAKALQRR